MPLMHPSTNPHATAVTRETQPKLHDCVTIYHADPPATPAESRSTRDKSASQAVSIQFHPSTGIPVKDADNGQDDPGFWRVPAVFFGGSCRFCSDIFPDG